MKKIKLTLLVVIVAIAATFAQAPQGFNYQGVARDTSGNVLINQNIAIRVSIPEGSAGGTVVYSEVHSSISDDFGVFDLVIGTGAVLSGSFSAIDWGSNSYFVKIEMDPSGGTNYELMGTSQLLSVPYTLYAEKSGNVVYSDTSASNELQVLSFSNDTLYLSNGGYVYLPFNYNDTSATNELQALSLQNDTLFLSSGNYVVLTDSTGGFITVFKDSEFAIINETDKAAPPVTSCTAALSGLGAGNVDNGTHDYKLTFVTDAGETEPGPVSNSVTVVFNGSDGKISLTNIPVSTDTGVTGRKIYRRFYAAGSDYKLVYTIPDNTTTIYIDSFAWGSLGDLVPVSNTTETRFNFDASQLTGDRTFTMPDKSGIVALLGDNLQAISFSNDTLYLTNGGQIYLGNYSNYDPYSFICGTDSIQDADGNWYNTVKIGGQCWMAENLNIGIMVNSINPALGPDSLLTQIDNDTIEKYCYDNNPANCDTFGGSYQWNEAMQYSIIEGTQGVCPVGWHIPTDWEWKELEKYLGMTSADANLSFTWRGTDHGDQLKTAADCFGGVNCGSSGFEALLAGLRSSNGLFYDGGTSTHLWSSAESGLSAWLRKLVASEAGVNRGIGEKLVGFSVRCVKD